MRVSANPGSPYFTTAFLRVTVDGQLVPYVVEANEELGWVDVLLPPIPERYISKRKNSTKRVRGVVQVQRGEPVPVVF